MIEFKIELVKYMPQKKEPDTLYISNEYETSYHVCPCGCKSDIYIPFNKGEWVLTEKQGKYSFTPSMLNRGCKAHYYITDNKVVWC